MSKKNTKADGLAAEIPRKKAYSMAKLTRVIVKYDAGWGNTLFIRGKGASGLGWEKGIPMQNIGCDEWLWEQVIPKGDVGFKILVNDEIWCQGEDFIVHAKESTTVRPVF